MFRFFFLGSGSGGGGGGGGGGIFHTLMSLLHDYILKMCALNDCLKPRFKKKIENGCNWFT